MSARHILGLEKVPRVGLSPIKVHASWVQNVVRQFGLYLSWAREFCVVPSLVERTVMDRPPVYQLFRQGHRWVSESGLDKR